MSLLFCYMYLVRCFYLSYDLFSSGCTLSFFKIVFSVRHRALSLRSLVKGMLHFYRVTCLEHVALSALMALLGAPAGKHVENETALRPELQKGA